MTTIFRQILCPIDFSDCSRHALDHAVAIARSYGGAITALHALQPFTYPADPMLVGVPAYSADDRERTAEDLEAFARQEAGGVKVETILADGVAVPTILEAAATLGADLLVLGTHGRRGFERFILGSTTERLLRRAPCPVLTVPPRAPDQPPVGPIAFNRILCAVDFSSASMAALGHATSLGRRMGASVTLLTVVEPMPVPDALTMLGGELGDFEEIACRATRDRLHALVPSDLPVTEVVSVGKPYREILARAEADRSDLIVIGVHGGSGVFPGFLGSTTNHVVREAACPVLSLRG